MANLNLNIENVTDPQEPADHGTVVMKEDVSTPFHLPLNDAFFIWSLSYTGEIGIHGIAIYEDPQKTRLAYSKIGDQETIHNDLFADASWNMEWQADPKDLIVRIDESKRPHFGGVTTFYYTILFEDPSWGPHGSTYVPVDWDPSMEIQPKADPI